MIAASPPAPTLLHPIHGTPRPREQAVEQAYDEYLDLWEAGVAPDIAEFCQRYPGIEEALANLLHRNLATSAVLEQLEPEWRHVAARVKGFTICKLMAKGSFAHVFLARQPTLGNRPMIIKLSRLATREAAIQGDLSRFQHPCIVPVYESGRVEGTDFTFIAMPFQGTATFEDLLRELQATQDSVPPEEALRRVLHRGQLAHGDVLVPRVRTPLPPRNYEDTVLQWASDIAEALAFMHENGYSHGDLKPSNVLITWEQRPILLDFNMSRTIAPAGALPGGTLPYMAPEMLAAMANPNESRHLDLRFTDQFAFGVLLTQLLTGQHPFLPNLAVDGPVSETVERLRTSILARTTGPKLSQVRDGRLARLLERCMRPNPEDRWPSFTALHQELLALQRRPKGFWTGPRVAALAAGLSLALVPLTMYLSSPRPSLERIVHAIERGEHGSALAMTDRMLAEKSEDAELLYLRARILEKQGLPEAAIADLLRSYRLDRRPERAALLAYYYGLPPVASGDWVRRLAKEAQELGLDNAANWNNLGHGYLLAGAVPQARECFNQALELDPELALAYRNRARCDLLLALRNFDPKEQVKYYPEQGIRDILRALETIQSGDTQLDAARLYACAGEVNPAMRRQAIPHLREAVRLGMDPKHLHAAPEFASLRTDPAFQQALQAEPLPKLCRQIPRVCHPQRRI